MKGILKLMTISFLGFVVISGLYLIPITLIFHSENDVAEFIAVIFLMFGAIALFPISFITYRIYNRAIKHIDNKVIN